MTPETAIKWKLLQHYLHLRYGGARKRKQPSAAFYAQISRRVYHPGSSLCCASPRASDLILLCYTVRLRRRIKWALRTRHQSVEMRFLNFFHSEEMTKKGTSEGQWEREGGWICALPCKLPTAPFSFFALFLCLLRLLVLNRFLSHSLLLSRRAFLSSFPPPRDNFAAGPMLLC